ncbi:GT2 family glycosyltransferase [Xanthomonas arboricola]
MTKQKHRLSIVSPKRNLGFAAGVNKGLAEIDIRFPNSQVLLINNDAILLPGALDLLFSQLLINPEARLIYPSIDHGGWVRGTVYYHRLTGLITDNQLPGSFPYPSGCCLLINLTRTGTMLFDEEFFMYGEDIELGARLGSIPGAMIHVQSLLVQHEGSASSGMATQFYETRIAKAHIMLINKLGNNEIEKLMMGIGRMLTLPTRAFVRCIRYRSTVPLKAIYHALFDT